MVTTLDILRTWTIDEVGELRSSSPLWLVLIEAYIAYRAACRAENLEPHRMRAWVLHRMPEGPLG
jgi:hypothetical protein